MWRKDFSMFDEGKENMKNKTKNHHDFEITLKRYKKQK
jgi:hypothetical protein